MTDSGGTVASETARMVAFRPTRNFSEVPLNVLAGSRIVADVLCQVFVKRHALALISTEVTSYPPAELLLNLRSDLASRTEIVRGNATTTKVWILAAPCG